MLRSSLANIGVALIVCFWAATAEAGPVIIDGTDANDHGSASGGVNISGWKYMESALENLAAGLSTGTMTVIDLGTSSGQARSAINSAFGLSSLVGAGWTLSHVDGSAAVGTWLDSLSTATTGILYLPSRGLSGGDLDASEMAEINAHAAEIADFVNSGGALFAMGETGTGAFGWLSTLIPGLTFTDVGGGGVSSAIVLTAAGVIAFPGLTNADVGGAIPWHEYFSGNLGSLSVLGTAELSGTRSVIIGGGAGTVIRADPVPEPGTLALLGLALASSAAARRRKLARSR